MRPPPDQRSPSLTYRSRHRLSGSPAYTRIFTGGIRKSAGGLTLLCLPNTLTTPDGKPQHRLGLSIGRRVGNAVRRTAIKRRLREAFRLHQLDLPPATPHTWASPDRPAGYDWILTCRPHEPLSTGDYADLLITLAQRAHREWIKRADRSQPDPASSSDDTP